MGLGEVKRVRKVRRAAHEGEGRVRIVRVRATSIWSRLGLGLGLDELLLRFGLWLRFGPRWTVLEKLARAASSLLSQTLSWKTPCG